MNNAKKLSVWLKMFKGRLDKSPCHGEKPMPTSSVGGAHASNEVVAYHMAESSAVIAVLSDTRAEGVQKWAMEKLVKTAALVCQSADVVDACVQFAEP